MLLLSLQNQRGWYKKPRFLGIMPIFLLLNMKSYSFRTIIEKDGKQYHGFVPALLGCHTYGKTIEETKKNLNEAIEGYLVSCAKHGDKIPIY